MASSIRPRFAFSPACALAAAACLGLGACNGPAGQTGPGTTNAPTAPGTTGATGSASPAADTAGSAATGSAAASSQGAPTGDSAHPGEPSSAASAHPAASGTGAGSAQASAAPSASESAAVAQGPAAGTDAFSTWLQSSGKYTAGVPGTVTAVLVAKPGYHCNEKYPYKLVLDAAPAGVSYPATTVKGISYGPSRSTLSVPFVPDKAGSYTLSGVFHLSVCTEDTCKLAKQPLSVQVTVGPGK
jgi:hypothetical protein